jgi:predicted nucleotidyltransferase
MTRLEELRQQRHTHWLAELKQSINTLLSTQSQSMSVKPDQIYLSGSRARGNWDGLSDTDLLVVSASKDDAERWADALMDHGLAEDVIALDREAWRQLPDHPSVIWRHVARDAQPLLSARLAALQTTVHPVLRA